MTEQTARLASGFFDLLDRGEQSLKGASLPVRVFDLRGPGPIRSRLERSRARGFSRFVGREHELALLERALRRSAGRATEGRPDHRRAGRGKEPPVSRVRRALPRRGAPLCPRALPRAHAPLPRDRRARARSLRRRRRRIGGGRPRRRGARSGERAARRPGRPGLLARASRRARSRAGPFGAGARGAPHASLPVALRSDPGPRSTRAHVALGRGPPLARPGERSRARDAHRASPGSGGGRQQGAAARDRAARVSARVVRTGRASLAGAPRRPRTPRRCSTTGSDPTPRWRRSAPGSRPAPAAIPSSSRRSFARSSSAARCAANAGRTRRPARSRRSRCPRPFRPSSRRASIGSRSATRTCSRPRRWSDETCRRSCCASWSICPHPSSPRRSSGSRRPSSSVPPSLRVSAPSGIPSRTKWPTARSFWIAGAGRTPASRARCSRSTDPRPRRTPRSSPITSRRRASTSRPRAGTSARAGASRAAIRRRE